MHYSVRLMLEKCANFEGEDRLQRRNSGCTSKESLFLNFMEAKSLSLIPADLSWHLGILQ